MYMLLISGSISLYFHFISPHTLQCKFLSQFGRWQYFFISFHFYFWSLSIFISLSTDCSCCSISCSAPPLSQLNVGPIAKRRPFQCLAWVHLVRTCRRGRRRLPGDGQQILSQLVHVLAGQTCYRCQICNRWSHTCICSQNIASMLRYTLALCSSRP